LLKESSRTPAGIDPGGSIVDGRLSIGRPEDD
jgi:hypothetical protein